MGQITPEGSWVHSTAADSQAFRETLGVETVRPDQLSLVKPARETVGSRIQILALLDNLPENVLEEVKDFAQFLHQKQYRLVN